MSGRQGTGGVLSSERSRLSQHGRSLSCCAQCWADPPDASPDATPPRAQTGTQKHLSLASGTATCDANAVRSWGHQSHPSLVHECHARVCRHLRQADDGGTGEASRHAARATAPRGLVPNSLLCAAWRPAAPCRRPREEAGKERGTRGQGLTQAYESSRCTSDTSVRGPQT